MIFTLRSRLTLVYTAVFGLLLVAIAVVSYRVLAYQLDSDMTANLVELTSGLHGYLRLEHDGPAVTFDAGDPDQAAFVQEATRYYQVFDANTGRLIERSEAMRPLGLEFTPGEVSAFRDRLGTHDIQTDFGRIRLSNSMIAPPSGDSYLLQVGVSMSATDRVLQRFMVLLVILVPVGLGVALLAGRWMAGVALRPLTRVANAARTIDVGALQRRLPIRGARDELDEVALAFNDTLARLEHAVGEMRQFSTALAHELRTPLTALRGEIEIAIRERGLDADASPALASQLEEIDKLKRLIDQILTLARAEAGQIALARDEVDLGQLARRVVDQLELVAQDKSVDLRCEVADTVHVKGDEQWLTRLLLNLLDNALKFTAAGGRVTVSVSREPWWAVLSVDDSGTGIEAESLPHLFERFFRADPARSPSTQGAGLGLSLVKWIVEQHHGRIDVDSQPGRGSTFIVRLPAH